MSELRNHVALVTLNRPAALNALSLNMILRLRELLGRHALDPEVYAVLINGAGGRAFCAGGDIRALYQSFKASGSLQQEFFAAEYPLDYLLYFYPKPHAVLLDGITLGGGMGIAQSSPLRIVGGRTALGMPEVAIGFFPDVGASYFLSRLPGFLGVYLGLTGVQIRAADALYCGLSDAYLPPAASAALIEDLADLRWSNDHALDLRRFVHARAARPDPPPLAELRGAIDAHFAHPSVAAIMESLSGERRPEFAGWARTTAELMRSRSPTMLSVTMRQLRQGAGLSLAACFRMELGMALHAFEQGDFIEGVRATLIEKDNSPRWHPGRVEDVTETMVDAFFSERWVAERHPLADLESQTSAAFSAVGAASLR